MQACRSLIAAIREESKFTGRIAENELGVFFLLFVLRTCNKCTVVFLCSVNGINNFFFQEALYSFLWYVRLHKSTGNAIVVTKGFHNP